MAELRVPVTSAERVGDVADAVLARPEFAGAQPSWWQRFLRFVSDLIGRFLELLGGEGRGSIIGTVALVVLAVLLVAVVIRYTRSLARGAVGEHVLVGGIGRSPEDWLADAAAHEAAGRWREAVRCRYRALLAELAGAGLVEEIAGRTSGEYLAAVRSDVPAAADAFAEATGVFERAWYGHDPTTAADVERFAAAARRSMADAGVRRRATAGAQAVAS